MIKKKPTTGAISLVLFSFFLVSFFLETTSAIMAADTSGSKIIVNGEEILIPGSSEKNITYLQILQKPNDLDLNLKYAQQQGKIGNYKQTIATLERLNMIYPDNVEIKLYLRHRRRYAGRRTGRCGTGRRGRRTAEPDQPAATFRHLQRYGTGLGAHLVDIAEDAVGRLWGPGWRGDRRCRRRRRTGRTPGQRTRPPGAARLVHRCGLPRVPGAAGSRARGGRSVPATALRPGGTARSAAAAVLLPGPLAGRPVKRRDAGLRYRLRGSGRPSAGRYQRVHRQARPPGGAAAGSRRRHHPIALHRGLA